MFVSTYQNDVLRPNVELIKTLGVERLTENGLITKSGQEVEADIIVSATGSTTIGEYPYFPLYTQDGRNMSGNKDIIVENYWGFINNNFPNMFYLTGPGCSGIQNIPTLAEHQANLIATIITQSLAQKDFKLVKVEKSRFDDYNEKAAFSRKEVAEIQKKDNFTNYIMNNHIYTNGENTHDFTQGGTLEYRYQLDDF